MGENVSNGGVKWEVKWDCMGEYNLLMIEYFNCKLNFLKANDIIFIRIIVVFVFNLWSVQYEGFL